MAMGRKRIHQLAADWGVKSKDILERLEKMGVTGKKAQSSLTEPEADRVQAAMGLAEPTEEERVVTTRTVETGAAGISETVVIETRIRPGVTLRRTKRSGPGADGSGAGIVPRKLRRRVVTANDVSPELLRSFDPSDFAYAAMPATGGTPAVEPLPQPVEPIVVESPAEEPVAPAAPAGVETGAAAGDVAAAATTPEDQPPASPAAEAPANVPAQAAVPAGKSEDDEPVHAPIDEPDKLAEEMLRAAEAREREERERAAQPAPGS